MDYRAGDGTLKNVDRIIGHVQGKHPGARVICLAGVHGNEPSGVMALQRVFAQLSAGNYDLQGELLGLVGNLAALAGGKRYIDEDFNRIWNGKSNSDPGRKSSERAELLELKNVLDRYARPGDTPVYFLDLHTTSSQTAPFAVISDSLANRSFARAYPIPFVLGLEETVSGTVPDYVDTLGAITIGLEAGQHDDPASVDRHEANIWVALGVSKCIPMQAEAVQDSLMLLSRAAAGLPSVLEIRERHEVREEDEFKMLPGFENFSRIQEDEHLANDRSGAIRATEKGHILLPLYQNSGDDGFFIARRINPVWLRVSSVLRSLRLSYWLHWLPGIQRDPYQAGTILVKTSVARWYPVEFLHLLGYRKHQSTRPGELVFTRRGH